MWRLVATPSSKHFKQVCHSQGLNPLLSFSPPPCNSISNVFMCPSRGMFFAYYAHPSSFEHPRRGYLIPVFFNSTSMQNWICNLCSLRRRPRMPKFIIVEKCYASFEQPWASSRLWRSIQGRNQMHHAESRLTQEKYDERVCLQLNACTCILWEKGYVPVCGLWRWYSNHQRQ